VPIVNVVFQPDAHVAAQVAARSEFQHEKRIQQLTVDPLS
jgi:hypothetical protein